MNLKQVMAALSEAGTEQNRVVYRRHGAKGELFGVGPASLDGLAQHVGRDHKLAKALWASKKPEARLLATMVADPDRTKAADLDGWARALDWYVGADALAKLTFHTPHARRLALEWIEARGEWIMRAGWHTLALLTRDKTLPDAFFAPFVTRIERTIHKAPNRARDAMNAALIAIGIRSDAMAKLAIAASKRIGKPKIDYGKIATTTPDAAKYIRRARKWLDAATTKRRSKKAPRAAAKKAQRKTARKK